MNSSEFNLVFILSIYCIALGMSVCFWLIQYISFWISGNEGGSCSAVRWVMALIIPLMIAHHGLKRKSLSKSGALAGLVVGFFITISSWTFLAMLLTFFLTSSKATRFMSHKKRKLEDDFKEGGQRDWRQVLCNGGVACQAACLYLIECGCSEQHINFHSNFYGSMLTLAVLGALSAACGDTWSSEFGTVLASGQPRLITTLKTVPTGTNGAISLVGVLCSILGGAAVGCSCWLSQRLLAAGGWWQLADQPPQWPLITLAMTAGLLGSLIDSFLGATLQYSGMSSSGCVVEVPAAGVSHISGCALLDNHSVNMLTTLATSCITPVLAWYVWPST